MLEEDIKLQERFMKSFRKNFPTLVEGRTICVVDCTSSSDPNGDKRLRRHSGRHPEIMKTVLHHPSFLESQESVSRKLKAAKYNLILNVCRGGKHRSEATAQLQRHVIAKKIYAGDLSKVGQCSWQKIRPESCHECTSKAASAKRSVLYQQAEEMANASKE